MPPRLDPARQEIAVGTRRLPFRLDLRNDRVSVTLGCGEVAVRPLQWREKVTLARFAHLGPEFLRAEVIRLCTISELPSTIPPGDAEVLWELAAWMSEPPASAPVPLDSRSIASVTLRLCRAMGLRPADFDSRSAPEVEAMWEALGQAGEGEEEDARSTAAAPAPSSSKATRIVIVPDEEAQEEAPSQESPVHQSVPGELRRDDQPGTHHNGSRSDEQHPLWRDDSRGEGQPRSSLRLGEEAARLNEGRGGLHAMSPRPRSKGTPQSIGTTTQSVEAPHSVETPQSIGTVGTPQSVDPPQSVGTQQSIATQSIGMMALNAAAKPQTTATSIAAAARPQTTATSIAAAVAQAIALRPSLAKATDAHPAPPEAAAPRSTFGCSHQEDAPRAEERWGELRGVSTSEQAIGFVPTAPALAQAAAIPMETAVPHLPIPPDYFEELADRLEEAMAEMGIGEE